MATKTRRRNPNSMSSQLADSAKKRSGQLFLDWATLTWNKDTTKIGPLPIIAYNWALLVIFPALGYFLPNHRLAVATACALWILTTIGRAAAVQPARRKTLLRIYEQNQRSAALPRITPTNGLSPKKQIQVRRWGKKSQPTDLTLKIGDCPAASSMYARTQVEKALISSLDAPPQGQTWMITWPSPTVVRCHTVDEHGEEASRQKFSRKVHGRTAQVFRINMRDSADYAYACSDWFSTESKTGEMVQTPKKIILTLGSFNYADMFARKMVERGLDDLLKVPGSWIYSWGEGDLEMTQVERKSVEARRKNTTRKINDDIGGLVQGRGDMPIVDVKKWSDLEDHSDYPEEIIINFGTRNLSERRLRDNMENSLDTSMEAMYEGSTWLYDWIPSGASTVLHAKAVAKDSLQSSRKYATKRLRNVVEAKFGSSRNFVDCDIVEWQEELTKTGESLPKEATVNFGDVDVTKQETQDSFEMHWDSLTTACDWHYRWNPAEGFVTMTAVPPLPPYAFFPKPGTPEFDKWNADARDGKINFGLRKGGGHLIWDFNKTPHGLIGGKTGMGKSVSLNIIAFAAMYNPDLLELVVCDPKRTDFTWTPEFPNVTKFAALDPEIVAAVAMAKNEMERRQSLLSRVGVRNIGELRRKLAENPELVAEFGAPPRRLVLFFDELADFLAKGADKDNEELKDEARSDLEKIARLGRAMEVNIVAAAQKPDSKIVSTQLRSQLGFRLAVGPTDRHESEMILNSDHGTRHPASGVPKGRAWGYDPLGGYQLCQVFFLADDSGHLDWKPDEYMLGFKDMVRDRLKHLGYASHTITNSDGGSEGRWAKVEGVGVDPNAPTIAMT